MTAAGYIALVVVILSLSTLAYLSHMYVQAQVTDKEWYNTGMSDAAEGLPYNPPTNPFSARHYRQGYYPIKNRYR